METISFLNLNLLTHSLACAIVLLVSIWQLNRCVRNMKRLNLWRQIHERAPEIPWLTYELIWEICNRDPKKSCLDLLAWSHERIIKLWALVHYVYDSRSTFRWNSGNRVVCARIRGNEACARGEVSERAHLKNYIYVK